MKIPTSSDIHRLHVTDGHRWIIDHDVQVLIVWSEDGRVDEYATFGRLID